MIFTNVTSQEELNNQTSINISGIDVDFTIPESRPQISNF